MENVLTISQLMMCLGHGDATNFVSNRKTLPNDEVRQATGMDCAYFTMKQFNKSTERRSNGNSTNKIRLS